jgi:2-aminoadipate transaminase
MSWLLDMVQNIATAPALTPLALPLGGAARRVTSSAIRELLGVAEDPTIISLAGGLPAPDSFPVPDIAAALAGVLADDPTGALQYSRTEGYEPLRGWVAGRHGVDADQVLITHGSQQALELVARASVDPRTVVALADPGYVGAIQAFRLAGAALLPVPSDTGGLMVDALARGLRRGRRPALVYVVPNFDNPTGATLTPDRARELCRLADRYGFLIVEDDPYRHLRWAGTPSPPLATFTERVVSLGTISKLLCPGLRVGYTVAPPALAGPLVQLKQAVDLHTSSLAQRAAFRVLSTPGFLDRHLARLRRLYRRRAETLVAALGEHLGDLATFRPPEGGMFIWVRVEGTGLDTQALLSSALAHGVAYVPGRAFGVARRHRQQVRLSFATASPDELDEGARRLRAALFGPGRAVRLDSRPG